MALGGCLNGYVTARYLKFFGTTDLVLTTVICAFALPLHIVFHLLVEAVFAWFGKLPSSYSFSQNMLRYAGLYLLHAIMCYFGAFVGY